LLTGSVESTAGSMGLLIAIITGYITYKFMNALLTRISRRKNNSEQMRQRARRRAKALLRKKQMTAEENDQLISVILPIISNEGKWFDLL